MTEDYSPSLKDSITPTYSSNVPIGQEFMAPVKEQVIVEIIACDSGDPLVVESACRTLGCETRVFSSHGPWLERWPVGGVTPESQQPDIVALVGSSLTVVGNDLITAARKRVLDAKILAVLTDPSFGAASAALKQSVHAVAPYVPDAQSLALELRWLTEEARSTVETRRESVLCRSRYSTLTKAELEVLEAMLQGKANKQIAELLGIGLRTVELRRSKIMRKMEAGNLAQLIRFICLAYGPSCTLNVGRERMV